MWPQSGNYNVVCNDANGCEVEAGIFNVVAAVSPISFGEGSKVSLFPNPVIDQFTVHSSQFTETAIEISIFNLIGAKVLSETGREPSTVNCELLPSGLYWLELTSSEKIYRCKFIRQ